MQDPLVSVKMITYNHEPYIRKAIDCVLMQKMNFPFELVIGEDCSTDGTREIVFDYAKRYPDIIQVITSEQNVGMKKNGRRTGQACRGKYIAYCEGDDYWHRDDKLQIQVDYLESHPECGLVCSDYDVYNTVTGKRIRDFVRYQGWIIPDSLGVADFVINRERLGNGIRTCTVMARKFIVEKIISGDPYLHQSENFLMGDTQLWAELSILAGVHLIEDSLATYQILNESAAYSMNVEKRLRFRISCANLILYLTDKYNISFSNRIMHEDYIQDCSLQLAFHEMNSELAEEVRKKKKAFTWKEWLRYFGAKNLIVNYGYRAAAFVINLTRKIYGNWG